MPKPARGYSWPPFEKDHTLSLRHGANSPRVVEPLAAECHAYIEEVIAAESLTFLQAPSFSMAKDNLAWSWAQVLKLRKWVLEHPEDMVGRIP